MDGQLTGNNNTVLHVAALFGHKDSVTEILKVSPSLLCRANSRGETSLHIAAREGHSGMVKALIGCAKETLHAELESGAGAANELLRTTNEDGDTALHEAARNQHIKVVRLLKKEDPEFSYLANKAEETPLYLAAEGGNDDLVSVILETCVSPAHGGPGGRSALHGAVISNSQACVAKILEWKPSLTKEADKLGWTPLHYAVHCGNLSLVKQLLDSDKSAAYVADNEDKNTALHIAANQDHLELIKELIARCPDCWEMVNGRGQNMLHIAVVNRYERIIKLILRDSIFNSLVNQKDGDGNTPLHLLAASQYYVPELIKHPSARKNVFNKENLTPLEVINAASSTATKGDLKRAGAILGRRNIAQKQNPTKEDDMVPRDLRQMGDTHLIVATLIATVTFAAGFTVPGGYDGNAGPTQGMAILTREAAFKTFVVTDTIALICSTSAIFIYFFATDLDNYYKLLDNYVAGACLIIVAMGAMLLAFITGLYAVLPHSSGLAVTVCVIGCLAFLAFYVVLKKAFRTVKR